MKELTKRYIRICRERGNEREIERDNERENKNENANEREKSRERGRAKMALTSKLPLWKKPRITESDRVR